VLGISKPFLIIFVAAAAFFYFFAEIDLWAAGLFYDPVHAFYNNNPPVIYFIYRSVEVLLGVSVIIFIVLLILIYKRKKPVYKLTAKKLIYLLLVLVLGPGLIVNIIFKDNWGRARPCSVKQFGGDKHFTPAFVISNECDRNCSFVSGHASFGFYFLSIAFLLKNHRKKVFALAIAYGSLVGFARIYYGDHFLSDVVFSFFFVYFVAKVLNHLMFIRRSVPEKDIR